MDAGAGRPAGSLPHRMLSWLDLRGFEGDLATALPRPAAGGAEPAEAVRQILADVRERGDDAVRELTARFDGVDVDDLRVPPAELDAALGRIPADLRAALEVAADAIDAYHRTQRHPDASSTSATACRCGRSSAPSTGPAATCPAAGPSTPPRC